MSITSMGFLVVVLLSFLSSAFAGDLVQWTDEKGTLHFSDSLDTVPAKYRGQAKLEKFKEEKLPQRSHSEGARAGSDGRILQSMLESWGEKPKLNSYEVPFEAYEGAAQRVIVSVTFNDSVTVPMLIDTGAPGLILSPQLAKKLGIFGNDEGMVLTVTGGIGGRTPAIRTFIDKVQVGGARDSFIPATVVPSISPSWEGLIGMDFMSKYSFKIDPVKQVVVFEELSPDPNSPGGHNERWWRGLFKEFHSLRAVWKNYSANLTKTGAFNTPQREFADRQEKEADKLLSKLDRYASEHSVPQTWR
jgi:clan AA aspartic protease (TIGR02281 family)